MKKVDLQSQLSTIYTVYLKNYSYPYVLSTNVSEILLRQIWAHYSPSILHTILILVINISNKLNNLYVFSEFLFTHSLNWYMNCDAGLSWFTFLRQIIWWKCSSIFTWRHFFRRSYNISTILCQFWKEGYTNFSQFTYNLP